MNCGTTLEARFCHVCGQRRQRRVVSLLLLAGDMIQDIFDVDSRMWRTLWPLFARPGVLTKSFMDGKRERYLPPVRLYLISSIIFFLLVSMSPQSYIDEVSAAIGSLKGSETSVFTQGLDTEITAVTGREFAKIVSQISERRNNSTADSDSPLDVESDDVEAVSDDATAVTLNNRDVVDVDSEPQVPEVEPVTADTVDASIPDLIESNTGDVEESDSGFSIQFGDSDDENADADDMDDFQVATKCEQILNPQNVFSMESLRVPLYRGCISVSTWGGFLDFLGELIDSLPKTLFILLPLMAFVNKLLYLFAGRYYVEHLLYYVHNYSFLFLFTLLLTGITKLADLAGIGVFLLADRYHETEKMGVPLCGCWHEPAVHLPVLPSGRSRHGSSYRHPLCEGFVWIDE